MSSSKLYQIKRKISVASYSWATNVLTIDTTAAHGLVATDVISFLDQEFPENFSAAIASTPDTDTFTVPCTNKFIKVPSEIYTGIFNNGATGAQDKFTWGWANYPQGLVQVSTNTTGTVTCKIEVSLDGINWVNGAAAQAIGTNSSYIFEITKPYLFGRLNFTVAVGGVGGKVTAFRVVA